MDSFLCVGVAFIDALLAANYNVIESHEDDRYFDREHAAAVLFGRDFYPPWRGVCLSVCRTVYQYTQTTHSPRLFRKIMVKLISLTAPGANEEGKRALLREMEQCGLFRALAEVIREPVRRSDDQLASMASVDKFLASLPATFGLFGASIIINAGFIEIALADMHTVPTNTFLVDSCRKVISAGFDHQ